MQSSRVARSWKSKEKNVEIFDWRSEKRQNSTKYIMWIWAQSFCYKGCIWDNWQNLIGMWDFSGCIKADFLGFDGSTIIMWENFLACMVQTLKYLGITENQISNLIINGSGVKNILCTVLPISLQIWDSIRKLR